MKNLLKKVYSMAFPTIEVKHCSQTIYQALLGTLHLYLATGDAYWKSEAERVKNILLSIQQNDGGFDIGYYFFFGREHNSGESTSPETLSLVALLRYWEIMGQSDTQVEQAIQRGIDWILRFSYEMDGDWVIPYGPYSSNEVLVYNGISFAQAPLAMWLAHESDLVRRQTIEAVCAGMNRYLAKALKSNSEGHTMLYSIPRDELDQRQSEKIDYYHMAQQLEMHNYTYQATQNKHAEKIIDGFGQYLLSIQRPDGSIPYVNNDTFSYQIHPWGYASTINAFIDRYKTTASDQYKKAAKDAVSWLLQYSWNGDYFYPVLTESGQPINRNYYPRSDAWVFNSMARYFFEIEKTEQLDLVLSKVYQRLKNCDFSGKENHASTLLRRKILVTGSKLLSFIPSPQ